MSKRQLLTEEEISDLLNEFPLWTRNQNTITREFVAANFPAGVGIINAIAIISEVADHHPDILLYGWNKVRVTLSTHDRGGLTELDFDLAKKIDNLNF